jgi:hypothetical protein
MTMKCKYCNLKLTSTENGYYCTECDLFFTEAELIHSRKELLRKPELSEDPWFFQYVTTKELLNCLTIELLNYLSLARKARRDLSNKVHSVHRNSDELDKDNLREVTTTLHKIETILIERNGYVPAKVYSSTIEKEHEKLLAAQFKFKG